MVVSVEDTNHMQVLQAHSISTCTARHIQRQGLLLLLLSLLACAGPKPMQCIPGGGQDANRCP
jgi:hypothetical protein